MAPSEVWITNGIFLGGKSFGTSRGAWSNLGCKVVASDVGPKRKLRSGLGVMFVAIEYSAIVETV